MSGDGGDGDMDARRESELSGRAYLKLWERMGFNGLRLLEAMI
jgi:hypothetical protein